MATKRPNDGGDNPQPKRQQLDSSGSPSCLLKDPGWTASDIAAQLPALPKPADPKLEKLAFAHISLHSNENYEDLEWVGDAWIQAISSQLIYETFRGSLKTGRLSQLRELLVCNKTLGSFLREYGLERRIDMSQEILDSSREPRSQDKRRSRDPLTTLEKIHGDVFEAYVGAILQADRDNGERVVTDWLKKLWSRKIQDEIRTHARSSSTQTPGPATSTNQDTTTSGQPALSPKVLLSRALVCRGVTLDYRDMPGKAKADKMGHNLFKVGVFFSGWGIKDELLAVGRALKKSEAGAVAAEEALKNKKLIKKYGEKKQAFLKARDEAGAGLESEASS